MPDDWGMNATKRSPSERPSKKKARQWKPLEPTPALLTLVANLKRFQAANIALESANKLAAVAGVNQTTVSDILKYDRYPTLDKIESLAKACNVTPAELLSAQPLSKDARYIGQLFDQITDVSERVRAWAIVMAALQGPIPPGLFSRPDPEPPTPPDSPPQSPKAAASPVRKRGAPPPKPRTSGRQ